MIALIKTPLQLICAVEYLDYHNLNIKSVDFVYLKKYDFGDLQMENTFNYFLIEKYDVLKFGNANVLNFFGKKLVLNQYLLLKVFFKISKIVEDFFSEKKLKIECNKHEKIILGDPNLKLFRKVSKNWKNKKIILLEDGLNSIVLENNFSKNENKVESFSFLRNQSKIENVHLSIENKFLRLKSKAKVLDLDKIVFIGQPLIEGKVLTLYEMKKYFEKLSERNQGKKIVYVPHRWEFSVNSYDLPANIEIESKRGLPIELMLHEMEALPAKVISFYSAALITLKKMLPETVEVSSINLFEKVTDVMIKDAYRKIESFKITMLDFD